MALSLGRANAALDAGLASADTVWLHTTAPGPAGTTGRLTGEGSKTAFFSSAAAGVKPMSSEPSWTVSGSATITHVAIYAGSTYVAQAQLTNPITVASGDTVVLRSVQFTINSA